MWFCISPRGGGEWVGDLGRKECGLDAPEPAQNVDRHDGDSGSGGDPRQGLFCAWLTVRETVAANHDGDEAGDLGDGSREQSLKRIESGIEGTRLGLRGQRDKQQDAGSRDVRANCTDYARDRSVKNG